jgi:hypothetical protein
MVKHLFALVAGSALVVVCLLMPFAPGGHDRLATGLSAMTQVLAYSSVLLVPIGFAWIVFPQRGFVAGIAAIVTGTLTALFMALASFESVGISLALMVLAGWASAAAWLARRLNAVRYAPHYMVVLPLVAAVGHFGFTARAEEFSRNRAIDNAAVLITALETHRQQFGRYPVSLQALHTDYDPGVIGIPRFLYEPHGESYNLFFEQFTANLAVREIVMYNPRDEHKIAGHDSDVIEWTPEQLANRPGYNFMIPMARPHWKRYLFD